MDANSALSPARQFWGSVRLRALIPYVIAGAILVAAIVIIGREIDQQIGAIEEWIQGISPWGELVYIALFVVLTSVFVPDTVLAIIAGAMFGLAGGTLAVLVGALVAAALQQFLARHFLRDRIQQALSTRPSLLAIQNAVHRQELRLQLLLRLTPLSPVMTSYLLGAAGVRLSGFFIGCVAMIPALFLEVYFGHAGKHMASMAGRNEQTILIHDATIVGGLLASIIVMVIVSRMARKALQEAVDDAGIEEQGP